MPGLAGTHDLAVPYIAAYARHDCQRQLTRNHNGPLLDVQLKVGADLFQVEQMLLRANCIHIGTHLGHAFRQGLPGGALFQIQVIRCELAEERARADIGLAKPRAFFSAKTDHPQRFCSWFAFALLLD